MILISFLVPVFNNYAGVKRILSFISNNNIDEFEFILINDCSHIEIDNLIKSSICFNFDNLIYINNNINMGAVPTWNKLITIARGKYIQFIHHDECPDLDLYGVNVLSYLKSDNNIIVLRTRIHNNLNFSYFHSYQLQKKILLSKYPKYIFWRNIIGSPSNIIVNRSICNMFDLSLKWYVDVEWIYNCIIKSKGKIIYPDNLTLNSFYYGDSITETVKHRLTDIKKKEIGAIKVKYFKKNNNYIYLIYFILFEFLKLFDTFLWILFRVILIITGIFVSFRRIL
jgi:glycosyltransferase involved in cell wall biosynthesis